MGVFDEFVENTLDHAVDTLSDPDTYSGPDDDDESESDED